jgi:hypothetical protein
LTQSEIGYKFNPQGLNTLNNQLLIDITNESAHRQEILRVVFPDENLLTPEDKLKSKQLFDQIIWPTSMTSSIDVRFGNEFTPAIGTGFHIGGYVVVMAGHIAEDDDFTSHYVVFDFIERLSGKGLTNSTVFKKYQVFQLKR